MSLDTRYRPAVYADVIGQDALVTLCRRFVSSGRGRHQSYVFSGPYGSGKTTLARILARALLCEAPVDGEPCDKCSSCRSLLERNSHLNFVEVDAATNSGKESVQRIVEEIGYSEFSGRQRLYLFDEAHQLSPGALDALLKPMEDNVPGSNDKRLVCIFATTEPERMRPTIFSRCAPAMVIQPVTPQVLAKRLAEVCDQEGVSYDQASLVSLAEVTECHIRDALKAIEGLALLGGVNRDNLVSFLHLDVLESYLEILELLGVDLERALEKTRAVLGRSSPATCYERLADLALIAYQAGRNPQIVPTYLDAQRLAALGERQGAALLGMVSRLTSRPARPTEAMLLCDLSLLHLGGGALPQGTVLVVQGQGGGTGAVAPQKAPVALQKAAPGEPVCRPGSRRVDAPTVVAPPPPENPLELDKGSFGKLLGGVLQEKLKGAGSK